ncbi:MAG: NAD(+) kinase [Candidatus Methanomethylicota archaeon]|nr:MAG: NAD(+) kinase [Candidatus Verstraetearchaeota archaeon]
MKIRRVGIASRLDQLEAMSIAERAANLLQDREVEVILERQLAEKLEWAGKASSLIDIDADALIIVGGDGTVLRTSRIISENIPMLVVNAGTVGFLSEVNPNELESAIARLASGNFQIEECTRIKAQIDGIEVGDALNEVSIVTKTPVKVLNLTALKKGEVIFSGRMDGLIIATRTGSTAYALSAGGPIIDPELDAFVLVPLCPLKIYQKPIVLPSSPKLEVFIEENGSDALVIADGQIHAEAPAGSRVTLEKSSKKSLFIRLGRSFYERLRERLVRDV